MDIEIKMKDGIIRSFRHKGRPGGSYTKSIRYEGQFVIVTDEWGAEMAIPTEDISEIRTSDHRWRGF